MNYETPFKSCAILYLSYRKLHYMPVGESKSFHLLIISLLLFLKEKNPKSQYKSITQTRRCALMLARTLQNLNLWKFFLSCLIPTSSGGILLSSPKVSILQIFRIGLLNINEGLFDSPK